MRITFRGLVTHATINIGGTKQQVAILPTAAAHVATFRYLREQVIPPSGLTGPKCDPLPQGCFDTNLTRGEVAKIDLDDLPSLRRTTTATALSPQVGICPLPAGLIHAIFFLPPNGRLFGDHYYTEEVDFKEATSGITLRHGPMPQSVIYTLWPAASNFTVTFGDSSTLTLKREAEIVIANVCPTSTGTHYQFYKNVLDSTVPPVKVFDPQRNGTACTYASDPLNLIDCGGGATVDVDCVNSQFP